MKISKVELLEIHAVLEPTAAYHELAARFLATKGMTVSLVNSARIRSFAVNQHRMTTPKPTTIKCMILLVNS
jgi:transposase